MPGESAGDCPDRSENSGQYGGGRAGDGKRRGTQGAEDNPRAEWASLGTAGDNRQFVGNQLANSKQREDDQ